MLLLLLYNCEYAYSVYAGTYYILQLRSRTKQPEIMPLNMLVNSKKSWLNSCMERGKKRKIDRQTTSDYYQS